MPGVVGGARLAGRQFGAIMFASCSLRFPTQISWLRITQFTLLRALARAGGPMTQDALGELLAVDSTTLSRTLRQLERSKWIRRVDRTRGSAASTSPLRGGAFSSARRPRGNACSGGSAPNWAREIGRRWRRCWTSAVTACGARSGTALRPPGRGSLAGLSRIAYQRPKLGVAVQRFEDGVPLEIRSRLGGIGDVALQQVEAP